jgi:hypothetical protein
VFDPLSDAAFSDLSKQGISDADRQLHVTFFYEEIPDPKKTEEMGRPIFKSVEMCSIKAPGDKDNIVVERVARMQPDPRMRFPAQYARFKAGEKVQIEGTLLRQWGLITPAEAKSYEAVDVYTVEQLAGLSDSICQQYRGSLADRQKARDFLDQAKGLEPAAAARAENQRLRSEIEALREAIASLGGKVPDAPPVSTIAAPKRRGRPPGSKNTPKAEPAEA